MFTWMYFCNLVHCSQAVRMLKSRKLFPNLTRAAILLYPSQIRHKTQCIDQTTIPVPFSRPPTIIIKSPYSVKVKPIDPVEFLDFKAVVGFLYLETETEEELSPQVKSAFQQDIQYDVRAVMSPSRDYMEVTRVKKANTLFSGLSSGPLVIDYWRSKLHTCTCLCISPAVLIPTPPPPQAAPRALKLFLQQTGKCPMMETKELLKLPMVK